MIRWLMTNQVESKWEFLISQNLLGEFEEQDNKFKSGKRQSCPLDRDVCSEHRVFDIRIFLTQTKNFIKFDTHILGYSTIIFPNAVPLQAWSGPEGSRKLRFRDFITTAQDGDKAVSLTHRPSLPPGSAPGTHFY